jgi:integrase
VRSRVDVLTVQRWLGHTSVATTQRYLGHYRDDAPVEPPTPRALRRGRR